MYAIIVGGGKVGLNLARELLDAGTEVALIEQRRDRYLTIESEFAPDQPIKGQHEEVSQHVGARLGGPDRCHLGLTGVHVVAVSPRQAVYAEPVTHLIQGAVGAAIRVTDRDLIVGAAQCRDHLLHLSRDAFGPVVQKRWQRMDGHLDARLRNPRGSICAQCTAQDEGPPGLGAIRGRRAHRRTGR